MQDDHCEDEKKRWAVDDEREKEMGGREGKSLLLRQARLGGIRTAIKSAVEDLTRYIIIPIGTGSLANPEPTPIQRHG